MLSQTSIGVRPHANGRDLSRFLVNGVFLAAACGVLLSAGCAPMNPRTATPMPAPVVQAPPPPRNEAEMGPPSATFVFLPSEPDRTFGIGTLSYDGKRYTFSAAGVTAARIGDLPGPISGMVYHLDHLRDINGVYVATLLPGGKEVILKNQQGVTVHMLANSGVEMDLETVSVKLALKG